MTQAAEVPTIKYELRPILALGPNFAGCIDLEQAREIGAATTNIDAYGVALVDIERGQITEVFPVPASRWINPAGWTGE